MLGNQALERRPPSKRSRPKGASVAPFRLSPQVGTVEVHEGDAPLAVAHVDEHLESEIQVACSPSNTGYARGCVLPLDSHLVALDLGAGVVAEDFRSYSGGSKTIFKQYLGDTTGTEVDTEAMKIERELGHRAVAIPADVGSTEALDNLYEQVVAELGGIDILVNNAASGGAGPISKLKEEDFQRVMAINLWAPIRLSQLCRTSMKERGGGMIINISSNEGVRASPGLGIYPPSKAALINFTELIGKQWAKDSIRAVAIAPGLCRTELAAGLIERVEKNNININPMGRIGEPEDIAALVLTLATQAGRFATATTYVLDGGELSAGPLG